MDFDDQPKAVLNMVKGAIQQQLKTQFSQFGMSEDKVKIRIEE